MVLILAQHADDISLLLLDYVVANVVEIEKTGLRGRRQQRVG